MMNLCTCCSLVMFGLKGSPRIVVHCLNFRTGISSRGVCKVGDVVIAAPLSGRSLVLNPLQKVTATL